MSNWQNPEDQEEPCKNCKELTSTYNNGFCSTDCENEAQEKTIKEELGNPKYTFDDVQRGRDTDNLSQSYFIKRQLKQKIAKLNMLGFKGEANRLQEQHKVLLSK